MQILKNASLKSYHTFGIEQSCAYLVEVSSLDELVQVFSDEHLQAMPKLILGKGSNVLFTTHYAGMVVVNRLAGIDVTEDEQNYYVHVSGGEDWPELVEQLTRRGIPGLENLALIPGCAGSAPVQNIGAYGIEFKDVCEYVDYFDCEEFTFHRLSREKCSFGYRDSIFKHALSQRAMVTAVGLKLPKVWKPNLAYGPLKALDKSCSAIDVLNTVTHIRQDKLPDPKRIGSAGSFFKNPVISEAHYQTLKVRFPDMVAYSQEDGVKVAAGWLIDQCGFKGFQIGGAKVHPNQALVIINECQATANDVIELAKTIYLSVKERYGIELEHEVRFIGRDKEVYLNQFN